MITTHNLNITPPPLTAVRQELVRTLIGDSLQPAVYGLLHHVGNVLDVQANDQVLFVALDPVPGALLLAREFGCSVSAVALAPETIERGHHRLAEAHATQHVILSSTQPNLPDQQSNAFDVVITEGLLAISTNKFATTQALCRVLRSHGRLALTEPTAYHDLLPEELRPLFQWLAPLAEARPAPVYRTLLGECGLTAFVTEDRRQDLRRAVEVARQKLLLNNLTNAIHSTTDNDDLEASVRLARQLLDLISQGLASYVLISAEKP